MKSLLEGIEAVDSARSWYPDLARATGQLALTFEAHVDVVGIEHPTLHAPAMLEGDWSILEEIRRQSTFSAGDVFQTVFTRGNFFAPPMWTGVSRPDGMGICARSYDLTLLARPTTDNEGPSRPPAESVLFESGRPLLLVPHWDAPVGKRIVVSWIDTPESARVTAFALPLLKLAEQVSILAIKNGRVPSGGAHAIAGWLGHHSVNAKVFELSASGSAAQTTLSFAVDQQADLLVKGAYTETRLQRFIFGDTTDYLISNARLPLLLAH